VEQALCSRALGRAHSEAWQLHNVFIGYFERFLESGRNWPNTAGMLARDVPEWW
jgi:hypothetical protein